MIRGSMQLNPVTKIRGLARRVRDWLRGETRDTYFDLRNPKELDPVLAAWNVPPFQFPTPPVVGLPSAMRFVLSVWLSSPRLQSQFPLAMLEPGGGGFAEWLCGPAGVTLGLNTDEQGWIRRVWDENPGDGARRIYETRPDLRMCHPLGLCPRDRGRFLAWLLEHGPSIGVTPEDSVWALLACDQTPDRGLEATYRVTPAWQNAVPGALDRHGWAKLQTHLKTTQPQLGHWFFKTRFSGVPHVFVQKTGVNVHAHFRYPSGLQEIGTSVVKALNHEGIPCAKRDLPVGMARGPLFEGRAQDLEIYPTTVVVAGANTKPADFYRISGLSPRDGVKRIAYVFWELEHVPASWAERLSWADEIWAPTQFIASAFRKVVQVPVIPMLPGVELPTFEPLPRSHFGLPEHVKLFLFTFDMNSTFERKNPLAVIRAFRRAARPSDNAMLVVKVSRGESSPADLAVLRKECDATGVILIDRVMSRGEVLALMNSADCYISLHRSEGLGLGMVESLMMGKPVIGTDYSGNQDFLTEVTGYPVQAGRTLVGNSNKEYPAGSVWAEPDVIHAAERIRWILDQPEEARAKGDLAREVITKQFQFRTFGERIRARLNQSSASSLPSQ